MYVSILLNSPQLIYYAGQTTPCTVFQGRVNVGPRKNVRVRTEAPSGVAYCKSSFLNLCWWQILYTYVHVFRHWCHRHWCGMFLGNYCFFLLQHFSKYFFAEFEGFVFRVNIYIHILNRWVLISNIFRWTTQSLVRSRRDIHPIWPFLHAKSFPLPSRQLILWKKPYKIFIIQII